VTVRQPRGATVAQIEASYRAGFSKFVRFAAALSGDRELGLDAVQEGFAKALRERRTFRGNGDLDAWLWRIVLNTALGAARRTRQTGHGLAAIAAGNALDDETWSHADVRTAVSNLPEQQRLTVFLRYYADLDYEQIAAVLGVRKGTVGASLTAARRTLADLLLEAVS
jgi:RNA polymerase sigma-70 factor (ECF subfamily)